MQFIQKFALAALFSACFITVVFAQTSQELANDTYNKMTLDEKIGQLLLPTYHLLATAVPQPAGKEPGYLCEQALKNHQGDVVTACGLDQIAASHVGAVLQDGGPHYNEPSIDNWNKFNALAIAQHQQVQNDPLLLIGNDAIHGNSHVQGAVIFPHNINLGVTHDVELVKKIGTLVASDSLTAGFNWVYMPTVAVAQDLRWGRTYESFGQDPQLVKSMAKAYISHFQQIENGNITGVLACAKHFIGDGATQYGQDEGDAIFAGSENQFWQQNGLGYEGALEANVGSVMSSFSAINGKRMHFGGEWNILNEFKQGNVAGAFNGFIVSDYNGATRAAYFYNKEHPQQPLSLPEIFAKTINAGVDMIMLGNGDVKDPFAPTPVYNYTSVAEAAAAIKTAYQQGLISEDRLKEAVIRILTVKYSMASQIKISPYTTLQRKERDVALTAAEESLVLLKNDNAKTVLSNKQNIKNVIFLGDSNDVGVQNGGWTINWQGQKGDDYFSGDNKTSSGAKTIEEALPAKLGKNINVFHAKDVLANPNQFSADNTIVVAVVAEPPYAEYMGDIGNSHQPDIWYDRGAKGGENKYMPLVQSKNLKLEWSKKDAAAVQALRQSIQAKDIRVITIVYSGRPVVLTEGGSRAPFTNSDVVIAAFLPGTLGGDALANAITGNYLFLKNGYSNRLTFPWPRDMDDVSHHFANGALFPVGFGLSTTQ